MNTRSLSARLKRLEFRLRPGYVPPQIVISVVDSKGRVLYKMRFEPGGNQYFSANNQPITKEEADQLSAASARLQKRQNALKAIDRRLRRLEDRFGRSDRRNWRTQSLFMEATKKTI